MVNLTNTHVPSVDTLQGQDDPASVLAFPEIQALRVAGTLSPHLVQGYIGNEALHIRWPGADIAVRSTAGRRAGDTTLSGRQIAELLAVIGNSSEAVLLECTAGHVMNVVTDASGPCAIVDDVPVVVSFAQLYGSDHQYGPPVTLKRAELVRVINGVGALCYPVGTRVQPLSFMWWPDRPFIQLGQDVDGMTGLWGRVWGMWLGPKKREARVSFTALNLACYDLRQLALVLSTCASACDRDIQLQMPDRRDGALKLIEQTTGWSAIVAPLPA